MSLPKQFSNGKEYLGLKLFFSFVVNKVKKLSSSFIYLWIDLCNLFSWGWCYFFWVQKLVLTTKSVEYMPFFLSFASFANGLAWTAYALIQFDPFIAVILISLSHMSYHLKLKKIWFLWCKIIIYIWNWNVSISLFELNIINIKIYLLPYY